MKFVNTSVLAILAAVFANASPVVRRDDSPLTVSIEAPSSVSSLEDLKVTTKITNSGSAALKVLKYNTPLSEALVQNFQLSKGDEAVAFKGIKTKFDLTLVEDLESVFQTIAPGETVTVEHPIGAIYDITTEGDYKIGSTNNFFYIDASSAAPSAVDDLKTVAATSNDVTVGVSGDLTALSLTSGLEKRARTSGCSSSQNSFIYSALSEGKALATQAANYISSNGANSLFTTYFGSGSTTSVRNVFTTVASQDTANDGAGHTWYCTDPYGACDPGVIAYSVPGTGTGAFCSIFFQERPTSALCNGQTTVANRDIRGATWLHEETHLDAGTDDYGYGVSFDRNLARTNPTQARNNADNYNVFAEEVVAASC